MRWIGRRRSGSEASCAEVAKVLQSYLDGHVDKVTSHRVGRHLERCRRCGLESETYQAIKDAIARHGRQLDPDAFGRLRDFGERLAREGNDGLSVPGEDSGPPR